MKATPLISSTLASAVVFLLMKLAVIAIASLPLNSFLLKPGVIKKGEGSKQRPVSLSRGNLALNHNYKEVILG